MDLSLKNLSFVLDGLLSFINSNDVYQIFPSLTMSMEDVLMNIARDPYYLNQSIFVNCSKLADKVMHVLESKKEEFSLGYSFEYNEEREKVMVYKKLRVPVYKNPLREPLKPLRKPNVIQQKIEENQVVLPQSSLEEKRVVIQQQMEENPSIIQQTSVEKELVNTQDSVQEEKTGVILQQIDKEESVTQHKIEDNLFIIQKNPGIMQKIIKHNPGVIKQKLEENPGSIMSSFKISCLNATLKFVKSDTQFALQYPDMSTEQAQFVKQMIEDCKNKGPNEGFKSLYDPLAESLKIFSLKYDFQLQCVSDGEMKQLKFVKTRKYTYTEPKDSKSKDETDSDSSSNRPKLKKLTPLLDAMRETSKSFKRRVLTQLKDFLRDRDARTHTFEKLSLVEFQFISHWQGFTKRLDVIKMFDVEEQMVLDEVRYYLLNKKYAVKLELGVGADNCRWIKFVKVYNPNTRLPTDAEIELAATAVPTKSSNELKFTISKTSFSSSNSSGDETLTRHDRRLRTFFRTTFDIKHDWIEAKLNEIRTFLLTESEASLVISSITREQKRFLFKWRTFLAQEELIQTFPPPIQTLLRDIGRAVRANEHTFKVGLSFSKMKKDTCNAVYTKKPVYSSKNVNKENKNHNVTKANINHNVNKDTNTSFDWPVLNVSKSKENINREIIEETDNIPSVKCDSADILMEGLKKGSSQPSLKSTSESSLNKVSKSSVKMPHAKRKLIDGLSQPLFSEKGIKMMRLMGWSGGALGARGEGITEPIMPALDLKVRAGFGAPRLMQRVTADLPPECRVVSVPHMPARPDLKLGLVKTVLAMVIEHSEQNNKPTEVQFSKALTQKVWSYMTYIVTLFNNRTLCLAEPAAVRALCELLAARLEDPDLMLTACWSTDKKNILLFLSKYYEVTEFDSKDWCSVKNFDKTAHKRNPQRQAIFQIGPVKTKTTVKSDTDSSSSPSVNFVTEEGDSFRHYILAQILDFCNTDMTIDEQTYSTKEIHLKAPLSKRQKEFVRAAAAPLHVEFPLTHVDKSNPVHKTIRIYKDINKKTDTNQDAAIAITVNNNCTETCDKNDQKPTEITEISNKIAEMDINTPHAKNSSVRASINETNTDNFNICVKDKKDIDCICIDLCDENDEFETNDGKIKEKNDSESDSYYKNTITDTYSDTDISELKESEEVYENVEFGLKQNDDIFIESSIGVNNPNIGNQNNDNASSNKKSDVSKTIQTLDGNASPIREDAKHEFNLENIMINITNKDEKTKITNKVAAVVQKMIIKEIAHSKVLPLLKCNAIQGGALSYTCHNKSGLDVLTNVTNILNLNIKIIDKVENVTYKMSFKINAFVEETVDTIFTRIEEFNLGLSTKDWVFIKKEVYSDYTVVFVEMDAVSFLFIKDINFKAYVGIDIAEFSLVWS